MDKRIVDNKPFVWLSLSGPCIRSKIPLFFSPPHCSSVSAPVDRTKSAYLNWPKGYSTPYNIMLGYKKMKQREGGAVSQGGFTQRHVEQGRKGKAKFFKACFCRCCSSIH